MQESRGAFGAASSRQDGATGTLLAPCGVVESSLASWVPEVFFAEGFA